MNNPQLIENEFGVPIAGKILDPALWARTALKKLPLQGPLDCPALFGRRAPLIIDLGCGNGRFLIGSALARPEFDHIGIDILPVVLRYATRRGNQRGLHNLRFAAIDGQRFLSDYIKPSSIRELHAYHPQPFHDRRDAHKRLLTPRFLAKMLCALEAGGSCFLQTDNGPYWQYIVSIMPAFFDFHEQTGPWPDAPQGRTRREIIALRRSYPVYRGWGIARADITREQAFAIAASLPPPDFDAGACLPDLDDMERSLEA